MIVLGLNFDQARTKSWSSHNQYSHDMCIGFESQNEDEWAVKTNGHGKL